MEGTDHFLTPDKPKQEEGSSYVTDEDERLPQSALRADDLDVYFRITNYIDKATRNAERFIQKVKWIPYSKRFEIFSGSIRYYHEIRSKSVK
jgi:hypothetical protein